MISPVTRAKGQSFVTPLHWFGIFVDKQKYMPTAGYNFILDRIISCFRWYPFAMGLLYFELPNERKSMLTNSRQCTGNTARWWKKANELQWFVRCSSSFSLCAGYRFTRFIWSKLGVFHYTMCVFKYRLIENFEVLTIFFSQQGNVCRQLAVAVSILAYINSAMNPFIYNFFGKNFRARIRLIYSDEILLQFICVKTLL